MRHSNGRLFSLLFVLILAGQCSVVFAQEELPCARTTASGLATPHKKVKDRRYSVDPGAWSSATVSLFNTWHLFDQNPGRMACFYSPDRRKKVEIRENEVSIFIDEKMFKTDFGDLPNSELGWAPDSSRLFVTWTDGGEEGQWRTDVYDVTEGGLVALNGVQENAREDFEKRIRRLPIDPDLNNKKDRVFWETADYCEPYNVVGSQWLNGSRELLVSVLVVNVGRCRYMGEFNVYRIALPSGAILERYTAAEAHKKFKSANLPLIVR